MTTEKLKTQQPSAVAANRLSSKLKPRSRKSITPVRFLIITMNFIRLLILTLFATDVQCFSASPARKVARPDTANLVEDALKISAAFGLDSKEAAVAWDAVEEVDSSDNSVAMIPSLDEECEVDEVSPKCEEYGRFLDELFKIRDSIGEKESNQKASLAETLKMVKLAKPEASPVVSSTELSVALEAAKAATSEHGVASVEARLAWETYEEIASSGLGNAVGINLAEECSVEAGQDACKAMEELDRVMPVLIALSSNN